MQGLKTQEKSKFLNFFSIVQETAKNNNCIFFLDAGDGRGFENEKFEGEDLMGWLIPQNLSVDFEKIWLDDNVSDDWSDYYVWAVWENETSPTINFDGDI